MTRLSILLASAMVLLLSSCNAISKAVGGVAMDTPEAWSKTQELIEEKVNVNEWKIVSLRMGHDTKPGEELSGDLKFCDVLMVDKNGAAWRQSFFLEGIVSDLSPETREEDFAAMPAVDLKKITPEQYAKQIEDAKKLIPSELQFECVAEYEINNTRGEGKPKCRFLINVTEKGASPTSNAGKSVTTYYELPFVVDEAGVVSLEE